MAAMTANLNRWLGTYKSGWSMLAMDKAVEHTMAHSMEAKRSVEVASSGVEVSDVG